MLKRYRPQILLGIVVALLFGRILAHDFIYYDDNLHLYENPYFTSRSLGALLEFWDKPYLGLYIPATYTVWGVYSLLTGGPGSPLAFHFLSLLFHAANAVWVFVILRRLLALLLPPEARAAQLKKGAAPRAPSSSAWPALAGALLFAAHPVQVEPVAWATELKDLLSAFFALASLHFFLRHRETIARKCSVPDLRALGLAAGAFVLGVLSKPGVVTLPWVFLAVDHLVFQRPLKASFKALAPWGLLALPFALIARSAQPSNMQIFETSLPERVLIALDSFGFYLGKILYPVSLGFDYGRTPELIAKAGWLSPTVAATLVVAAMSAWVYRKGRREGRVGLLALVLLSAPLLPVSGLVPFVFQWVSNVADRYLYFGMLGAALFLGYALARAELGTRGHFFLGKAIPAAAFALIALLGARSFMLVGTWKDTESLFSHAIALNPRSYAGHDALGNYYLQKMKNPDRAIGHYRQAIGIFPAYPQSNVSLGGIHLERGEFSQARERFRAVLSRYPHDLMARMNLGITDFRAKDYTSALESFSRAYSTDPALSFTSIPRAEIARYLTETRKRAPALAR